jgi:hypothetical protein
VYAIETINIDYTSGVVRNERKPDDKCLEKKKIHRISTGFGDDDDDTDALSADNRLSSYVYNIIARILGGLLL